MLRVKLATNHVIELVGARYEYGFCFNFFVSFNLWMVGKMTFYMNDEFSSFQLFETIAISYDSLQ